MFQHDDRKPRRLLLLTLAASMALHLVLAFALAGATVDLPGMPPDDREQHPVVHVLIEDVDRADVDS